MVPSFRISARFMARIGLLWVLALSRLWRWSLWGVSKVGSLPSRIYSAGKLQPHFTCGFDFGHSLWLPFVAAFAVLKGLSIVPMGTVGSSWPGPGLFGLWEEEGGFGLSLNSGARQTCMPSYPRVILLVSFSDTLLEVSILDIVYGCHLWPFL